MAMISFEQDGDFTATEAFIAQVTQAGVFASLESLAQAGVSALASATPFDTGQTANSWDYEIEKTGSSYSIIWTNSHMAGDTPVAIMLQYGHGTGTGGYVQGRDFINPAIQPVMDQIADKVWKQVMS